MTEGKFEDSVVAAGLVDRKRSVAGRADWRIYINCPSRLRAGATDAEEGLTSFVVQLFEGSIMLRSLIEVRAMVKSENETAFPNPLAMRKWECVMTALTVGFEDTVYYCTSRSKQRNRRSVRSTNQPMPYASQHVHELSVVPAVPVL